jgi:hypothetical protein
LVLVHDLLIPIGEFRNTHSGGDVFGAGAFGDMTRYFEGGHPGGACGGNTYYMRTLAEFAVARVRRVNDTRAKYCSYVDEENEQEQQVDGDGARDGAGDGEEPGESGGGEAEVEAGEGGNHARRLLSPRR